MYLITKISIAFLLGLIGYELEQFFLEDGLRVPLSNADLIGLFIYCAVAFAATFLNRENSHAQSDREHGTVKWFNTRKGYGFITRDQGEDVFVHFKNIKGSGRRAIREGERVSFVVVSSGKGPQADLVRMA